MQHELWLTERARRHPDRVALECEGVTLTYDELHQRAAAAAGRLLERGVQPGDRVALARPPGVDFVVAFHACLLAGAAVVPVDPRLGEEDRAARVHSASAAAPGGDEVVMVVHTSGTTSEPKSVAITTRNVWANAVGSALALGLHPRERWLCPMPLTHVGGLMVLLRSLVYGTTVVLLPPPFDAAVVAERLNRGDATVASLVPTMLLRALDAGLSHPKRLRCLLLGGGPADPALLERALAAGVPVAQTYGLSEATSQVTVSEPGEPFTAGPALPGVLVRLAEDGEILVEGPVVTTGGVLHTGDLGALDERGRLTVVGRKSDTIVTGGENVAPVEVEAVLLAHPDVADAAVLGRADPEWGEAIVAKVVPRDGADVDAAALAAFCRERLAGFKVPKAFERSDAIPRTASGKILRRTLT
jgi:O-succinylbenzoic acid--CoA ligase